MANKQQIDISLQGCGPAEKQPGQRPAAIDVPLTAPKRPGSGFNLGAKEIDDAELEIVNEHHRAMKERHRRARGE